MSLVLLGIIMISLSPAPGCGDQEELVMSNNPVTCFPITFCQHLFAIIKTPNIKINKYWTKSFSVL